MNRMIRLSMPNSPDISEIPVLYEDSHLLAVDKPAGLLTAPDAAFPDRPDLLSLLHAGIAEGKPWATQRGLQFLMNAQALDTDASGVLLFARSKEVLRALANTFGSEKPARAYVALAAGSLAKDEFEVSVGISPDRFDPSIMRANPKHGKRSRTAFHVVKRFDGYVLLRCDAHTDRPQQIRVHLKHYRLPVVGDSLHAGRPLLLSRLKQNYHLKPGRTERPLLNLPALHAERLEIAHPVTGEPLSVSAPWPKDMQVAVKYLERYCPLPVEDNPS